MRFKQTYLRKNEIILTANIDDNQEYEGMLYFNGAPVGVPLFQVPFDRRIRWRADSIVQGLPFTTGFFPDADRTTLQIVKDYSLKFSLRYKRADGQGSETIMPDVVVSKASVPVHYFNRRGNPLNATSETAHRLTYQPLLKRISIRQPEFIYFWNNIEPAISKINVSVTIYFTDGTKTVQALHSAVSLAEFELAVINASPIICEDFLLGRELKAYDIEVADNFGRKVFDTHCYVIDTRSQHEEVFVVYENSFGLYDTLCFFGSKSQTESVTKSFYENENGRHVFDVRGRRNLILNTGYQEQFVKESLPELLYSANVFIHNGLDIEPVNVLTTSIESYSTYPDENIDIEFEYPTEDQAFKK